MTARKFEAKAWLVFFTSNSVLSLRIKDLIPKKIIIVSFTLLNTVAQTIISLLPLHTTKREQFFLMFFILN